MRHRFIEGCQAIPRSVFWRWAQGERMIPMTASAGERPAPFRVVLVCTGNICRSPMAQVVFREFADAAGLGARVVSTSSGTGDWHVGEPADQRTIEALHRRGYDGTKHRARQFTYDDFAHSDLVVALDRSHERILKGWARGEVDAGKIGLLMSFDPAAPTLDVPD